MKDQTKRVIKIVVIVLSILLVIGLGIFGAYKYIEYKHRQENINNIYNIYNNDNRQDIITNYTNNDYQKIAGTPIESEDEKGKYLNAIGTLEIPSINFKDIVIEGTSQQALSQGIGLFEHSNILQGNVCVAGHNTYRFLANLKNVKQGDKIIYSSCLGNKEYTITTIKQIDDTDWSMLQETEDNRITIITCVRNKPTQRLCVQAIELL